MVKLPFGVGLLAVPTEQGVASSTSLPSITYTRWAPVLSFTLHIRRVFDRFGGRIKARE
jgi:hypothetical protein